MLYHKFNPKTNILETEAVTMSFSKTKSAFWYYDFTNNTTNAKGLKNEPCSVEAAPEAIAFVRTHYLPKAVEVDSF